MKSLNELAEEIRGSDELKKAFVAAMKAGAVADFLKAQDCDATMEDVREYLADNAEEIKPLSLEDMNSVAGGEDDSIITQTVACSDGCTESDTCCSCTCIEQCC